MNMKEIINSLYVPKPSTHKGQNGKLFVIGGSKQYHGAPIFSLLAARRFIDLLYFYSPEYDEFIINAVKRIPEVIVRYDMYGIKDSDCTLFGIGLADANIETEFIFRNSKKLVIDGDGLKRLDHSIPAGSILTPHEREFQLLFGISGTRENVKKMAKKHNCIIVKKGHLDIVSDGTKVFENTTHNQGMTKGGTGDVLAGFIAAIACKNDNFSAAVAGTYISGYAGNMLKKKFGYSYCASDLAETLAEAYFKVRKF